MKKLTVLFALLLLALASQIAIFAQTNEILISNARTAIEKNDYVSALRDLNAVLAKSPNNEQALAQRARIFARQQKYAEATQDIAKVLAANPKNYEALNVRGVVKRERDKDLNGALTDFTKAVAIKPDFYLGYVNIAFTNHSLGKYNETFAAYQKAIEISPQNPFAYDRRGISYLQYRKYKEAIADFDKVLSITGDSEGTLINRGYCHFRMYLDGTASGDLAKSDVEKTLKLNPANGVALSIRSILRFADRDVEGARSDAEKSLQADPKSFLAYMARGFVLGSTKRSDGTYDHNSALIEFDNAYKLAPRDSWVKDKRFEAAKNLSTPLAKQIQEELKNDSTASVTAELEKAKQKVAANPWDFAAYDELNDVLTKGESSDKKAYWESLIAQNSKNICAIRFLGEFKGNQYYMDMVNYLEDGLRLYDGKNGAECAAEIARRIAREYDSRQRFDLAKNFYDKAKSIKSDLGGLDSNIAGMERSIERNRSDDERLTKRLAELDKTRKQGTSGSEKKVSEAEFQAILAIKTGFDKLNQHSKQFSEYANTWNSSLIEQERGLALSMKTECQSIIAIAEELMTKYPSQLNASDTDYLKKTMAKKRSDLAKIEIELKKLPE